MHFKFNYLHDEVDLIVHAHIVFPESENGIDECESSIDIVTTLRGVLFEITPELEKELEIAALETVNAQTL